MDLRDKEYLAHTLKSIAGGALFLFLAGFIGASGPALLQWAALAVAVVFWALGSLLQAWCDLQVLTSLTKHKYGRKV